MNLSGFLMVMAGPLARQVMISLGLAVVTFTGVDLALGALLDTARSAWSGSLGADVAAYVAMSGANTGLGMLAGAMVARVAMMSTKSLRFV